MYTNNISAPLIICRSLYSKCISILLCCFILLLFGQLLIGIGSDKTRMRQWVDLPVSDMPMIYRIVPHLYMVCRSLQEVHNIISKQSREVVVVLLILVVSYCCIIAWLAALDRNQHALGVDVPVMICIRSGSVFTNSDLPILFYNLYMHKFTLQKVPIKAHQILTHKQFLLLFHIFYFVDSKGEKWIRSEFTSDIPVNIIVPTAFLHMQKFTSK